MNKTLTHRNIRMTLLLASILFFVLYSQVRGQGRDIYVSPAGSGTKTGDSPANALAGFQAGLNLVQPGDTLHLGDGIYKQTLKTVRGGTIDAPITIIGGRGAILNGSGNEDRTFEINHDFYILDGWTIDGKHGDTYQDKLLYVMGTVANRGPTGIVVRNMKIGNALGECIRLRYFVTKAQIYNNEIGPCGILDFEMDGGGKNGEGIYIGTSSNQWGDGKNPTSGPDVSRDNYVFNNVINTQGNECVDIKEGATANVIEGNDCTGGRDTESAGMDSRGSGNTFRGNTIHDTTSGGIRFGGHTINGVVYGVNNSATGNTIRNNSVGGIKVMVRPQNQICGNTFTNQPNPLFGTYGSQYAATASAPCAGTVTPTNTSVPATPTSTRTSVPTDVATTPPTLQPTSTPTATATLEPTPTLVPIPTVCVSHPIRASEEISGTDLVVTLVIDQRCREE